MFDVDRPVERRIARFGIRPDDIQLGTELGYGLMGGSGTKLKEDEHSAQVLPQQIPIVGVAIWMYFVLGVIATILFWVGENEPMPWIMLIFGGGIFIIPTMMGILSWINKAMGSEPYLVFDKAQDDVSLPRLSMTFNRNQLREIVFLDRFVEGNRFWQVALLIEEGNDQWIYVHLYNAAGDGTGMQWFGVKELYEQIAESLGIQARRLKFSKAESQDLAG